MENICKKCGSVFDAWKESPKTFSNGTKHVELRCPECDKFYQYKPQHKDFVLYFGKYKGKKVSEVMIEDYDYLWWLMENADEKLAQKIEKTIASLSQRK